MNRDKKMIDPSSDVKPGNSGQFDELDGFEPKTGFGKELWALRRKAVAEGMTLMKNEDILAELESRRYGRLTDSHE